ncbi:DUF4386 family protein [Nonomuraea sp. NPDC049709]|uniref:DUF4386 family protein n=1 Tax=Nonomuraea sp. NPDC049709 TaxID=3154736 RepID=UPI0034369D96
MVAGIISLLAIVTLRQAATAGADAGSLVTTGNALVAIHNWTFLLGPGLIPAVNALLLGYLLYSWLEAYRSRRVTEIVWPRHRVLNHFHGHAPISGRPSD